MSTRNTLIGLVLIALLASLAVPAWAGKDPSGKGGNLTDEEKARLNAYVLSLIRKNQDIPPPPPPPPPKEKPSPAPAAPAQGPGPPP